MPKQINSFNHFDYNHLIGKNPPAETGGFLRSLVMKMLISSRKKNFCLPLMKSVYKTNMSEMCQFSKTFLKKQNFLFRIL